MSTLMQRNHNRAKSQARSKLKPNQATMPKTLTLVQAVVNQLSVKQWVQIQVDLHPIKMRAICLNPAKLALVKVEVNSQIQPQQE